MTSDASDTRLRYDDLPRLLDLMSGDEKHDASGSSTIDVLWVLYDLVLDVAPDRVSDPARDRFVLSKGHGPMGYYAVLAAKGFVPEEWLTSFSEFASPLGHHPNRSLIPGVEVSSGSLGHGLPIATGIALGLRAQGIGSRVVALVGDGELDEGSNAEAIAVAARLRLGALTVVVIDYDSSSLRWPGGIDQRFAVEGWQTRNVDGRDHDKLAAALSAQAVGTPHAGRGPHRAEGIMTMDETMRNRFTDVTTRLLDEDPRVAVVLAVISADRFTTATMRHPGRVVDVGIRERLLVSVAGGMASTGLRPVVHTIATFLVSRPYEQIKLDLGHQGFGAVLVSTGASYDHAESGRTHQAPEDVALLDTLQDWTVHVPGHADELEVLLPQAAAGKGNVYLPMSGQTNRAAQPVGARFTLVRRGGGPVVVAVGPMLDPVLSAVEGTEATVLYAATVRPFDGAALRAVAGSVPDVVLVEPYRAGTSSQHVSDALRDRPHRPLALGVDDVELRRYGSAEQHAAARGLAPAGIRAQVAAFVGQEERLSA